MRNLAIWACLIVTPAAALLSANDDKSEKPGEDPRLTVERIFASGEFHAKGLSAKWAKDGDGYLTVEGSKIVRHDAATGETSTIVSAVDLTPPGESNPLPINSYAFSKSGDYLLVYTNSKRVWRQNSRGDYWVLDRSAHELRKLGGDAPPSTLQFAKLAPTGSRAAFVRDNNLYVEDLRSGQITELTSDGSDIVINGTFDWVYEEELQLRDGFRWSDDGRSIAYWQIDTSGVREFTMINNNGRIVREDDHIRPIRRPARSIRSAVRGSSTSRRARRNGSICRVTGATTTLHGWSGFPVHAICFCNN